MSQSAYIKFVEGSAVSSMTLDEVKEQLNRYQEQVAKTGKQLNWEYADAAFPYTIETKPEGEGKWFYLKGKNNLYHYILFGVGSETVKPQGEQDKQVNQNGQSDQDQESQEDLAGQEIHFVQVVLPDQATHGDKAKANEFCKYFARHMKAELTLFNGRTMYFNPRK